MVMESLRTLLAKRPKKIFRVSNREVTMRQTKTGQLLAQLTRSKMVHIIRPSEG